MAFSGWYPSSYIRMPYSGIANNNVIWPWHVGDLYYEVSGIEQVIGFNPLNGYASITARISGVESGISSLITRDFIDTPPATLNNSLVSWSGGTGNGLLANNVQLYLNVISGVSGIFPMTDGTAALGSIAKTFATGYFKNIETNGLLVNSSEEIYLGTFGSPKNISVSSSQGKFIVSAYQGAEFRNNIINDSASTYDIGSSSKSFATGYFDVLVSTGININESLSNKVSRFGDSMDGDLTMNGSSAIWATTIKSVGTNDLSINPGGDIFLKPANGRTIKFWQNVAPSSTSTFNIGSPSGTFKTGYFDGIMLNGTTLTAGGGGVTGPASSVNNGLASWNGTAGTALLNNNVTLALNILSGLSGVIPGQSGINNIGSASMAFATGYFNDTRTSQINGGIVTRMQYMEEPVGLVNGINSSFNLTKQPYGNSLALYQNGILMLMSGVHSTTVDYILSGVNIGFVIPPGSGATLIAQSYSYLV